MKIPLAAFPQEPFAAQLLAPCGCDCLHFESVEVRQADDVAKITQGRIEWVRVGENEARGSTVVVNFWCEAGHKTQLALRFHKGAISADVMPCARQDEPMGGLWRD